MTEIINKITEHYHMPLMDDGEKAFVITEEHSISDIARWIIEQGWSDDFKYVFDEQMEEEKTKELADL